MMDFEHKINKNEIIEMTKKLYKMVDKNLSHNTYNDIVIFCIGTDRVIGDILGPLTGTKIKTYLKRKRNDFVHVYGTIENPVHAQNIEKTINEVKSKHNNSLIIAIDACMLGGHDKETGEIEISYGSIHPGAGVGKDLPYIGDIKIKGFVHRMPDDEDKLFIFTRDVHSRFYEVDVMANAIFNIIKKSILIRNFNEESNTNINNVINI